MKKQITKINILHAIENLLKNHTLNQITISMIVKNADVSRQTFYYYFDDKFECAYAFFRNEVENVLEEYTKNHDLKKMMINGAKIVVAKSVIYRNLFFGVEEQNSFFSYWVKNNYELLKSEISPKFLTEEVKQELYLFVVSGFYLSRRSILGKVKYSQEQAIEYFLNGMPAVLKPLLQS
ncbi:MULTISPECIES: TetR family transcriptional regulator [Lactobacillus]|uniref:TetR family transcriptional regulator n=1 Tax=Lactobacillus TaxID=1578 RepID=UPI000CD96BF1|nr:MULTISPECIES: TetR family transcriptional regulator [Lactobacillus]RVU72288.1 TetR family transcriptional regulator [Lactobacillus xujianguonis]